MALPGLRRAVASLAPLYHGDPADLQAEVLTGFLAAMRTLDLDDLEQVPLASRLYWAARRAGLKLAWADAGQAARRAGLDELGDAPALPWGHPDFVLAAAVRKKILTLWVPITYATRRYSWMTPPTRSCRRTRK
jgi:hypothetical protein